MLRAGNWFKIWQKSSVWTIRRRSRESSALSTLTPMRSWASTWRTAPKYELGRQLKTNECRPDTESRRRQQIAQGEASLVESSEYGDLMGQGRPG